MNISHWLRHAYASFKRDKKNGLPWAHHAHELFIRLTEVKGRPAIQASGSGRDRNTSIPLGLFCQSFYSRRIEPTAWCFLRGHPQHAVSKKCLYGGQKRFPFFNSRHNFFRYQGAENEGCSFETPIPAMKKVNASLLIAGDDIFLNKQKK